MSLDTWQRQERAFGLLTKVYAKRAKLRGEQAAIATSPMILPEPDAKLQSNIGVPSGILAANDAAPIAGMIRLGVCQPGRRLLARS